MNKFEFFPNFSLSRKARWLTARLMGKQSRTYQQFLAPKATLLHPECDKRPPTIQGPQGHATYPCGLGGLVYVVPTLYIFPQRVNIQHAILITVKPPIPTQPNGSIPLSYISTTAPSQFSTRFSLSVPLHKPPVSSPCNPGSKWAAFTYYGSK